MTTEALKDDHIFGVRGQDVPVDEKTKSQPPNKVLASKAQDFHFGLRGYSFNDNLIIDACSNIIALIIRVKDIEEMDEQTTVHLYQQVRDEITSIETELRENGGYDKATLTTTRYIICTVVDEFILSTTWGRESHWSQNSMLSIFHGEVYGGDKIYKVLARLQMEPDSYRDLIELVYIFLSLGYRGRYALEMGGEKKHGVILKDLTSYMRKNYPKIEAPLTDPEKNIVSRDLSMVVDIPTWLIFLFSFVALFFLFVIFDNTLTEFVEKTLAEIKAFHVEN